MVVRIRQPSRQVESFGLGTVRPGAVGRHPPPHRHGELERVDADLGLGLEARDNAGNDLAKRREKTL